jgi:hypothetical protein
MYEYYHPAKLRVPRDQRVDQITTGMGPKAIVDLIGAPDYVRGEREWVEKRGDVIWEYDMDATLPYTLRIVWKDRTAWWIRKIEPPLWKNSNRRDQQD